MHGNVSIYNTCIRKMHPFLIQKQSFLPYLIRLWNSAKKNLNQFITQKYNSRNSNPIVLLYHWETFHKYYSLKAKAQYCILHYDLYKRNISDYVDITQTHNISSLHVKIILKLEKIFYKNFLCMAWRKNIYISLQRQDCNSAQYQIYLIFVRDCLIHIWFTNNCSYNPFDLINKIC